MWSASVVGSQCVICWCGAGLVCAQSIRWESMCGQLMGLSCNMMRVIVCSVGVMGVSVFSWCDEGVSAWRVGVVVGHCVVRWCGCRSLYGHLM